MALTARLTVDPPAYTKQKVTHEANMTSADPNCVYLPYRASCCLSQLLYTESGEHNQTTILSRHSAQTTSTSIPHSVMRIMMRATLALVAILALCNTAAARELLGAPGRLLHLVFGRYIAADSPPAGAGACLYRFPRLLRLHTSGALKANLTVTQVLWGGGLEQRSVTG